MIKEVKKNSYSKVEIIVVPLYQKMQLCLFELIPFLRKESGYSIYKNGKIPLPGS